MTNPHRVGRKRMNAKMREPRWAPPSEAHPLQRVGLLA
jgi:hypothetical protein